MHVIVREPLVESYEEISTVGVHIMSLFTDKNHELNLRG